MQVTVRSYIAAGVVPVVAGLMATTPIAAHPPELHIANLAPRLTASVANILPNLIDDIINIPANELIALGDGTVTLGNNNQFSFTPNLNNISLNQTGVVGLTSDFTYAGNWWVVQPTNVLGTDPGDVPRYESLVNVLVPIPALSVPLGNALTAILASQLPMNIGCTETNAGGCNNPLGILGAMFHLQDIVAMFSPAGFTFPDVYDPVTCDSSGTCNRADPAGQVMPWSGQTVKISLNPFAPVTPGVINPLASFVNSLMQDPTGITPLPNPVTTVANLGTALFNTFNPFVIGTQCEFCAPFVPGSGVTFAQAIKNSIESFLSVIPGYSGPLPNDVNGPPNAAALTAKSAQEKAGPTTALAASSTTVDQTAANDTSDAPGTTSAVTPSKREQHQRLVSNVAPSDDSQGAAANTAAADDSQASATNQSVGRHRLSNDSKAGVVNRSASVKPSGTTKSFADRVKSTVAKGTGSKAGDSAK